MRQRERNFKNKYNAMKISRIQQIEVRDDYWKKDFWKHLTLFSWRWRENTSEKDYLWWILFFIHQWVKTRLDRNNPDVKFMLEDLQRYTETSFPKNEEVEQRKELFFSCWKILLKLWHEDIISEKDRWMYEDEFNEYCERMDKLQADLVAEMN